LEKNLRKICQHTGATAANLSCNATKQIVETIFLRSQSESINLYRIRGLTHEGKALSSSEGFMANLQLQINNYRLTTAEILYHMPDHPALLQSFIWQNYDIAPKYPELHRFLDFWSRQIEGKLHSVKLASRGIISAAEIGHANAEFRLQ
jgi:uncharacterized protein Usg